jgi:hypothetical protein
LLDLFARELPKPRQDCRLSNLIDQLGYGVDVRPRSVHLSHVAVQLLFRLTIRMSRALHESVARRLHSLVMRPTYTPAFLPTNALLTLNR